MFYCPLGEQQFVVWSVMRDEDSLWMHIQT